MTWRKGQSGNPSGRRRHPRILGDSLKKLLREPRPDGLSNGEAVVRRLVRLALEADPEVSLGAIKVILERVDGKVPDQVNLGDADGGSLAVPILPDYRAALASLAPGPVAHSLPPGQEEGARNGTPLG